MSSDQKVTFTQEQIDWLEKEFPELTLNAPASEMRYQRGIRSVIARIRQVSRVEVRYVRRAVPS